ncbi:hypothetical protein [Acidovorax sp.]|uniref:hypothetical protein n=1 Tax=Acidovorax sp. TaxID=1872122 RepID=UPI002ACF01B9|nr:hypothetical protein [Acidovorax sp.]MDZ7862455.1 hypothetical protein [Acidovorax sp.]
MSKTNGKQTSAATTTNPDGAQTSTAAAAPADSAGAVVQPTPASQATKAPDQHHGRGGAYTRVNGVRVPVTDAGTTTEGETSNA